MSNGATLLRLVDAVNTGDALVIAKVIDEIVEPDVLFRASVPTGATGAEAVRQAWEALMRALPDLHVTVCDLIEEGDKVVARHTITGTHLREYRGLPPTGQLVARTEILAVRFAGGRIAEIWGAIDVFSPVARRTGVAVVPL